MENSERNERSKLLKISKWSITPALVGTVFGFMSSTDPQVRNPYLIELATGLITYLVEGELYVLDEAWEEECNEPWKGGSENSW